MNLEGILLDDALMWVRLALQNFAELDRLFTVFQQGSASEWV
jgi:hypothetical protein